jgi:hypothetical protein
MENKKKAVFGIYTTVAAADVATDSLVKSGFSAADVSALLPENLGSKPIATRPNRAYSKRHRRRLLTSLNVLSTRAYVLRF